jgi:cyclase
MNRKTEMMMLACLVTVAGATQAQAPDPAKIEYRTQKVAEGLNVLFGGGGNIAVLTGPDGAFVVDSDIVEMSAKLRGALALVTDQPPRFLVNTHFHFDHAGGNATIGRSGTVIVAHDNVRKHLMTRQVVSPGVEIVTEPMARDGLPVVTFDDGVRFHVNGEEIAVYHVANAHTDSDALVFFEQANVLHTGDLMMSIGYPFVDSANGGSLAGLIAAQEKALGLSNEKTRVIPGHGSLVGKADLQAYHDMLATIRGRVAELVRKGRSLEQVQAAAPSKEFDERWGKGFFTADAFVQRVYIELSKARAQASKKPG